MTDIDDIAKKATVSASLTVVSILQRVKNGVSTEADAVMLAGMFHAMFAASGHLEATENIFRFMHEAPPAKERLDA